MILVISVKSEPGPFTAFAISHIWCTAPASGIGTPIASPSSTQSRTSLYISPV